MAEPRRIRTVAVIGAGVSGISAAVHLQRAGLDVTVYERSSKVGGVWLYDERSSKDASYPSTLPSTGDSPELLTATAKREKRHDSPLINDAAEALESKDGHEDHDDVSLSFAPPGPCYVALKNNTSTIEMELSVQQMKPGTEEFANHSVLAEYLQDTARNTGVLDLISFNTRIDRVQKIGDKWRVDTSVLARHAARTEIIDSTKNFDAVIVANGNYHAVNIPDIPGLSQWKKAFLSRVRHSKQYRTSEEFKGQNVLLLGAGVSSSDIARDIGNVANVVLQSSRGGQYDLPSHLLPVNGARIGGVEKFESLESTELASDGSIPGSITLSSGESVCSIHQIIVCTGYHVSLPFLPQYHADSVRPDDANEEVLITDGRQTHNLHKDIWYIPDPTLAFIGVPYHVATWSLYEYQALAIAAVWSGRSSLPSTDVMREEYNQRLEMKGAGRPFHSLRAPGAELEYCEELARMINGRSTREETLMPARTEAFLRSYHRRGARMEALYSQSRDPDANAKALELLPGC